MKFDDQTSIDGLNNHEIATNANQIQINDYNYLRKTKSYYESNNRKKFNNSKNHYQHLGNIMDLQSNLQQIKSVKPDLNLKESYNLPDSQHYRAADGTQYKVSNSNGLQTTIIDYPSKNVIHVPGKYHELYRTSVESHEIPQNIRHKFGTNKTEQLLNDQVKVHDTLSHIQNAGIIKKHDRSSETPSEVQPADLVKNMSNSTIAIPKLLPGSDYYDLGNFLRHSICHGYPSLKNSSTTTTKSSYNESISKEHLSDLKNFDSPYRRRKDWLGQWTEQSIVSKRITQDLAKSYAEKAKAKAEAKA